MLEARQYPRKERVVVVGNCQAAPIAEILAKMNPGVLVDAVSYTQMKDDAAIYAAADRLKSYHLILTQNVERPTLGPMSPSHIKGWHCNVVEFPAIIFDGFHPDFTLIEANSKNFVSATGFYHSLIVAACFAEGVPIDRVKSVFNPFTFKILGYFDAFENAKSYLLSKAGEIGYDLSQDFERWKATGRFMYTTNHPTLPVLLSLASAIARKSGLSVSAIDEGEIDDGLARAQILPIYPPIAKPLGLTGSYSFTQRVMRKQRDSLSMLEYIIQTYELYQQAPKKAFQSRAIQRTAELLRDYLPLSRASAVPQPATSA